MELSIHTSKKLGNYKCWYCGIDLHFGHPQRTTDHFWPKSLGGKLRVVCCKKCNNLKGDMKPDEFIEFLHKNSPNQRMITAAESLWEQIKWSVGELDKSKKYKKPMYFLIDARGGTECAIHKTNYLSDIDENWERFVLYASESSREICQKANTGEYGDNCVVANNDGVVMWKWYKSNGKWSIVKPNKKG